MRNEQLKNKATCFLVALFFLCCEVSVEWRKARLTGTAERNKVNDRSETFWLCYMLKNNTIADEVKLFTQLKNSGDKLLYIFSPCNNWLYLVTINYIYLYTIII